MTSLSEANRTLMVVQTKFDSTHAQCQSLQKSLDESDKTKREMSEHLKKMKKHFSQLEDDVTDLQNEARVKVSGELLLCSKSVFFIPRFGFFSYILVIIILIPPDVKFKSIKITLKILLKN